MIEMDILSVFVVLVLLVIGGVIGYGIFGIGLLGFITQFLIAGMGAWLWDRSHPKYIRKVCGFKSASEEKMRDHIRKTHIASSPKSLPQYFKVVKKGGNRTKQER